MPSLIEVAKAKAAAQQAEREAKEKEAARQSVLQAERDARDKTAREDAVKAVVEPIVQKPVKPRAPRPKAAEPIVAAVQKIDVKAEILPDIVKALDGFKSEILAAVQKAATAMPSPAEPTGEPLVAREMGARGFHVELLRGLYELVTGKRNRDMNRVQLEAWLKEYKAGNVIYLVF